MLGLISTLAMTPGVARGGGGHRYRWYKCAGFAPLERECERTVRLGRWLMLDGSWPARISLSCADTDNDTFGSVPHLRNYRGSYTVEVRSATGLLRSETTCAIGVTPGGLSNSMVTKFDVSGRFRRHQLLHIKVVDSSEVSGVGAWKVRIGIPIGPAPE